MQPKPVIERLLPRVSIDEQGCWIWGGYVDACGYGRIRVNGVSERTHRVTYVHYKQPIPEGLQLDHICRNRRCCNPDHLEAVTSRENTMRSPDAVAAVHARKTHCYKNHELTPENLYGLAGFRKCKLCHKAYQAEYRRKKKVA